MTDSEYRIEMHALDKRDTSFKEQIYEGSVQGALAIMSAWIHDAQTIANIIGETVCVYATSKGKEKEDMLSAYSYVDPEVKQ